MLLMQTGQLLDVIELQLGELAIDAAKEKPASAYICFARFVVLTKESIANL